MKIRPLLLFMLLGLLVIAFSAYQFFSTHEYREVTKYTPFKGEARTNPLYAARLFLKQMGIPAENKHDLQSLRDQYPDANTVIILATQRATLSLERTEKLLEWVRNGGHLVTAASIDWELQSHYDEEESENEDEALTDQRVVCPQGTPDCLLSRDPLQRVLEVHTAESVYLPKNKPEGKEAQPQDDDTVDDGHDAGGIFGIGRYRNVSTRTVKLPNARHELILAVNPHFYSLNSNDKNEYRLQLGDGTFLIQRSVGKGLITLISDMEMLENQLLREADNAEILWHLVHSHLHPSAVWLFHDDEMPNLFVLIWRYGWTVVLTLTALLMLWLYQSLHRFGPVIPRVNIGRRRLLEHIKASGQFFWKHDQRHLLVQSARDALQSRIARRFPGWHNQTDGEKLQHLAAISKQPTAQIKNLLYSNHYQTDEDFTRLISEIEKLRRQL